MKNFHDLKIWVRLVISIWFMLFLVWGGMIYLTTLKEKAIAIDQAKDFSSSVHEMTMAGLTGMMITGTVAQRTVFLDQIKQLNELRDVQVIRGDAVVKLFGPGVSGESSKDKNVLDVIKTAKTTYQIEDDGKGLNLHAIYPVIAKSNYLGKNCLTCHMVPEGTVLGAVSMKVSLEKATRTVHDFTLQIIAVAIGLSFPLMFFVYTFIRKFVTEPLEAMSHGLRDIAQGQGDLTRRLKISSKDEIGSAALVFNQMMDQFQGLIGKVASSASQVMASSRQLSSNSQQVLDSANSQRDKSSATALAVEDMAAKITSIAESAEHLQQESEESRRVARQGEENLAELAKLIGHVSNAVREISSTIHQLVESTNSITNMTQQVKDIADQTNLLALNAAIEAARAGEQGRGFAVVADEVRKLAEKSGVAANEIDKVTLALRSGSTQAENSMQKGLDYLASGEQSLVNVEKVLAHARSSVEAVSTAIDLIVAATENQRASSNAVASNMESIKNSSNLSSDIVQDTVSAVMHLDRLSTELQAMVERFKT